MFDAPTVGHGWTAEALHQEIRRLESLLDSERERSDTVGRCASAYLRQVLADRRSMLKQLEHRALAARAGAH